MADTQEDKEKEARRKREERQKAMRRLSSAEEYWNPNKDRSQEDGWEAGRYFTKRMWNTDKLTSIPPMYFTDHPSGYPRDCLQIVSIKVASIREGLLWPIDVFGMVTARDVLDIDRRRNIIFARARSDCQTITEEHPYLELTGPTRAIVTCIDLGNIEIVFKVKGATESDDRDLSLLVLTLKESHYCSFDEDYHSKCSTLKLEFHHINRAVEATITVRFISGSSLPPGGFQGVFTASTASIDDAEILLLAFKDAKLHVADDGTISLSRRVVSVGYGGNDHLKVSILAQCDEETGQVTTRDDIVFTPQRYGRSCGVLNFGMCKIQVTVAWSLLDY